MEKKREIVRESRGGVENRGGAILLARFLANPEYVGLVEAVLEFVKNNELPPNLIETAMKISGLSRDTYLKIFKDLKFKQ